MREELDELDFKTNDSAVSHLNNGANGDLGFKVNMDGIEFVIIVRCTNKPRIIVTKYVDSILKQIGITLDSGQKDGEYYNINEFKGQHVKKSVIEFLLDKRNKLLER